jgi:hypothetical protein
MLYTIKHVSNHCGTQNSNPNSCNSEIHRTDLSSFVGSFADSFAEIAGVDIDFVADAVDMEMHLQQFHCSNNTFRHPAIGKCVRNDNYSWSNTHRYDRI